MLAPMELDVVHVDKPLRLDRDFMHFQDCVVHITSRFRGDFIVDCGSETGDRLQGLVLSNVFIYGDPSIPCGGLRVVNSAFAFLSNVCVFNTAHEGAVIDSAWNLDYIRPHIMYCHRDGGSACIVNGEWAGDNYGDNPKEFLRQTTNDARFVSGRMEGSATQLTCVDSTDVVALGTKFHGDPGKRDVAGPLVHLVNPRGPQVFRGHTLAHGAEPQFSIEWGDKQAHVSIDAVDSDWPLNKSRDLVGEVGQRPAGSDLEIVKRVNTR